MNIENENKQENEKKLTKFEKGKILTILALYFIIPSAIFGLIGTKLFHFNPFLSSASGFAFAFIIGYALGLHKPVDL